MKKTRRGIACMLAVSLLATLFGMQPADTTHADEQTGNYNVNGMTWKYGIGEASGFNENTYKTVEKSTTNDNWRDGSVTANGEIGFIESCDPNEDVFIFNNTKIVTDSDDIYETPVISNILDEQRLGAIQRNNFPWIQAVNDYAQSQYGTGWGTTWPRKYQPAAQYRIKNNNYTSANSNLYNRYTNYETGEVGVQWKDTSGNEWNRRSFASRSDDVIVTYIEAPEGQDLNITISVDNMVEMRNQGTTYYRPTSDNVVTQDSNGFAFGMVGKYAVRNRKGSKNTQETMFAHGGWGTATRIITDGNVNYAADKRDVNVPSSFGGGTIYNANDPKFTITETNSVILITKVDRIDSGCNTTDDVKNNLFDVLVSDIDEVADKYSIENNEESYQNILKPHVDIHGGMFRNVSIDLCSTEEEIADRALTNTQLIAKQNSDKGKINKAFLERIYNNGRFGLICASGYGSARLGAIWNGTWEPDWSGDYTFDANVNLQVSGMNTGNMPGAGEGYMNLIIRMVEDWVDDATNIYGMEDAIKAPPRVDGTGEAGSYHFLDVCPHIYVNGLTDWLIIPMFEYWQCYGNRQIKVGKDVDMERNKEVLDLSDDDLERINSTGYMDLEKDILFPMLKKTMNFWLQYVDERFYTDGNGVEHANDGTTITEAIEAGDTDCKYIFTPGYSPENFPGGAVGRTALSYNTTMDISASRDTLFMARAIMEAVNPEDKQQHLEEWEDFESKIPNYLYDDVTGALKEWATPKLAENHYHRHVSQAYAAWPGYESQTDDVIREGIIKAMECRSAAYGGKEASESHGPTHKALVEARLKNSKSLENVLLYLLTSNYQYSSMMTSHNDNHSSTYCTDSAFGIMGAMNESLLYSNTGVIEILPTLLESAEKGNIKGLRARCNTQCDIDWDVNNWEASVVMTSDSDNNVVKVRCGLAWESATINGVRQNIKTDDDNMPYVEVTLNKGAAVKVDFALTYSDERINIKTDTDINKSVNVGDTINLTAMVTFERRKADSAEWSIVNAADNTAIDGASVVNGILVIPDSVKGKTIKISATVGDFRSNELMLHVASDKAESFEVCTAKVDDDIAVAVTNDSQAKDLTIIWAAYDSDGKMINYSSKYLTLDANSFGQIILPTKWPAGVDTKLYIWNKNTMTPYTEAISIK
ncbi:MAG: hypothetical protein E7267_05615 [Lachnospiraceae bacterium]|nr:hypothetical protein [Lachnospiraceae bacterium]